MAEYKAYLFDKVINDLRDKLAANLPWLNECYGRAERLVKTIDGRRIYTPNVYIGNGEYEVILPDDRRGNYAFFVLSEPQDIINQMQTEIRIKAPFSLIVWVDCRRVEQRMQMPDRRNTEYVKEAVLGVLQTAFPKHGSVSMTRIYERAENVWDGFTMDEVQNQFMMSPFAGFRFTGELIVTNDCTQ